MPVAERIRVRGQVQGVGFRPFVWRLAVREGVCGAVRNDGAGVEIEAQAADAATLDRFAAALRRDAPPLAAVEAVERRPASARPGRDGFEIAETGGGPARAGVTPDAATCPACAAEIRDPAARRFGYAFANCTHCGPRFTIVERIPYDRASTTMRVFEMCAACRAEYEDPSDRRFHAQPIACPDCGPALSFERAGAAQSGDPIALAAAALTVGEIVAIRGVGGFQLVCDAADADAVARLRARKRRPDKPFALMAASVDAIARHCAASAEERALLQSPAAPITLLQRIGAPAGDLCADAVAPGLDQLGWMLPTTPLHHLLLDACARPLVVTSGNLSGEPQAVETEEARRKLSAFADAFLTHNRPIARRLDDSVARVVGGAPVLIRRARGYAPATLPVPDGLAGAPDILATGGDLKAAVCVLREGRASPSHHLGDLDDALAHREYVRAAEDIAALVGLAPRVIACDQHPGYRSTAFARAQADALGARLEPIQHHHAHIVGAMAEAGWPLDAGPVIGVALDGAGWGADGTIWGGEILLCGYVDFERLGGLVAAPLPGGDAAAKQPWRNLVAQLDRAFGAAEADAMAARAGLERRLAGKPVDTLRAMMRKGLNAPLSSSTGRLFDAVAAAIGRVVETQTYEGQTGATLESLARPAAAEAGAYPFGGAGGSIDPAPMWRALMDDLARGAPAAAIAARFHNGLADAFAESAVSLARSAGVQAAAVSGGAAQNLVLSARLEAGLRAGGLATLRPQMVPANDGGLAFGQAVAAAAIARQDD